MTEYWVLEQAFGYGISVRRARRFTEEEKPRYTEWFRETGFVGLGDTQHLKHITWDDLPRRKSDGSFRGCDNRAWIVTPEEAEAYIALDKRRGEEKAALERAQEIEDLERLVARIEQQGDIPTQEEARRRMRRYNDIMNEGGEGYVPHIYSDKEYVWAKDRLAALRKPA